ncbi:hypothetical protein AL057_15525 [Pseudomonas amygdali pv. myricae]|nr:hypothetical protein AL057_15525 [Pseudomonas amygdali pv. myricae]
MIAISAFFEGRETTPQSRMALLICTSVQKILQLTQGSQGVAADRKLTQVFNCFCSLSEQENTG